MAAPFATSYLPHFGLTSEPFSNAPVTRFYFESDQHQQALVRLGYALSSMKGLAVVMGDIGTGKTTLARRLLDALPESEFEAALLVIIHSGVDASWLLRRIAMQLGVAEPANEKLALLSQLYQRLVQIYESGKKAVVLIDEAQMLATRELMEEFRGLLNLEVPERKLISFVFFGLPDIDTMMNLDPPLKQRVALKFNLEGMTVEGTTEYVDYRLKQAGATRAIFTPLAMRVIHRAAAGTPRVINTLCDNLLLESFLAKQNEVSGDLADKVARQLGLFDNEVKESSSGDLAGGALSSPARASAPKTATTAAPARPAAEREPAANTVAVAPIARTAAPARSATPVPRPAAPIAAKAIAVTPAARSVEPPPSAALDAALANDSASDPMSTRPVAGEDMALHEPAAIPQAHTSAQQAPSEAWQTTPAAGALPKPPVAARPLATVQLQKMPASQVRAAQQQQRVTEIVHARQTEAAVVAASVSPDHAPASPEPPVTGAGAVALPKAGVNLDEIDSLLASIRRN